MKKWTIATIASLSLTAIPIVAEAASYVGPVFFDSVTTYVTGSHPFTTNSGTLHIYGVQSCDNGTSNPDMVYDLGSNYYWEQTGTFTSSDWGHYWYGVSTGLNLNTAVWNASYWNNETSGPATSGNFYVANS